jgi:hypothetical protein
MRQPQIVRTTLGDLIAAVTEEVTAVIGDSPGTYIVVSYVVSDLLSRRGRAMARATSIVTVLVFLGSLAAANPAASETLPPQRQG